MSAMLFIIVLVASFIIVRIGAVAFQLTGLEWSLAKFQSLSCFSGTGFTTKEAELITGDIYAAECVEQKRTPFLMRLGKTIEKLISKGVWYEKTENDRDSCCVSAGAYRCTSEHPVC